MLPNKYRWKIKSLGLKNNIVKEVLYARGIKTVEQVEDFLYPNQKQLHSPYLLNDMEKAVDYILKCKEYAKEIVVYGDYDVDGVTSTSILYMFLKELGCKVSYYIPNRQTEGYGLNKEALKALAEETHLIITVDTGIAAIEEVEYANSLGLKCIITDHHECQESLPNAYCVVNPKRPDTNYPFENLAGVGVSFKLIHAIALKENCVEKIWKYIDIAALGTVADVVPLENENRIITHLGFEKMKQTEHVGLRAMLEILHYKEDKITSNLIGYQIGPRINAAGRISDAKIGVELLTTKDELRAKEIAKLLDEENKKRQDMESEILEQALTYIEEKINLEEEKVIVVTGENWHHGVIGIVASRIVNKYYRPTIILSLEEGVYSGSARSIDGYNIFEALTASKAHLLRFGGHEMAAGMSLEEGQLKAFKGAVLAHGQTYLTEEMLIPNLEVDLAVSLEDLSLTLCEELGQLEPFGAANPTPIFSVKGKIQYAQKIGQDKHLKLSLQQDNTVIQAVGFELGYLVDYLTEGEEVVVAGEIVKNVWNDRVNVQLRIKDIQSCEDNILKSQYYLSLYHYMKEPALVNLNDLKISQLQDRKSKLKALSVYTYRGLKEIYGNYKNYFTTVPKVCYNKVCSLSEEEIIVVNPLAESDQKAYIHYDWDLKTAGAYGCFKSSLDDYISQVEEMVPSHADCKYVYKLLQSESKGFVYLHKVIESLNTHHMTEYKLLQILDIFEELGLMTYSIEVDKIVYSFLQIVKTNLENSRRYRHLQQFKQIISQKA